MGCFNAVVVDAPADEVWKAIRDFHDGSAFPNVIENLEVVGEKNGTEVGAKRILNGGFHETLLGIDDANRTFRYSIDDGPEAVSNDNVTGYVGEVSVQPVTDTNSAYVTWSSDWESSGGGVKEFCDPIYAALLQDLKEYFAD